MRTYFVPLGRIADYPHPAPERTAYRPLPGMFSDYEFKVWASRGAMLEAVRMSESGEGPRKWSPLVKEVRR